MTPDEKRAFCRQWYTKGVCPACGTSLRKVAGVGIVHSRRGVTTSSGTLVRRDGHPAICDWTADGLTALCHIGSGLVG